MEKNIYIVGRPNVGKSMVFNKLVRFRRAIVLDLPGTTVDEVVQTVDFGNGPFELVDTQGIQSEKDVSLIRSFSKKAAAFLLVVDGQSGPIPFDESIAKELIKVKQPVLLCVNKCEGHASDNYIEFMSMGFKEVLPISAAHETNFGELKEWCEKHVTFEEKTTEETSISLALVGRPNTGKSTLMNWLCCQDVSRVSPKALTTRDPVHFDIHTRRGLLRLVDTAGIRKSKKGRTQVEVFSIQASRRAVRDADVSFLLIDSTEKVTDQDMRLLRLLSQAGKPAAILFNFWDKLDEEQQKEVWTKLSNAIQKHLSNFELLNISGLKGYNLSKCLDMAFDLVKKNQSRVPTAALNKAVREIVAKNPPPAKGTKHFNILYASQVKSTPPTFVFFTNRKEAISPTYRRYLDNELRHRFDFVGQSLRLFFRSHR